jgi:hypothetical protein
VADAVVVVVLILVLGFTVDEVAVAMAYPSTPERASLPAFQ